MLRHLVLVFVPALVSCGAPASPRSERDASPRPIEAPSRQPARQGEANADEWFQFRSDEGRFTAEFPRAPTRKTIPVPTAIGELEAISHEVEFEDAYYMVSTIDYATGLESDPQSILDGSRDGTVANIGGELISERQLTIAGAPARRLLIRASTSGVAVNLDAVHCLVGNRLYQAVVIHKPSNPAGVERFLSEFKPSPAAAGQ